ncbi:MAG: uroporphyrinogen decarboxylase family protein [Verrucomicrobiota bacterium]
MMTPRERWLALFEGRQPDRVPTDYWATPEFHAKLKQALGVTDDEQVWQKLGIDRPAFVWAPAKAPHHPDDPQGDIWGMRHASIDYGTGSYGETVYNPLAHVTTVKEINDYRWPAPDDFDYSKIPARHDRYRILVGGHYEPFLLYCAMRGMEQAFEDVLVEPAIAEAALTRIFDICSEINRRIWEAGNGQIDLMYLAEDLGGQTGPLFSLDVYRRFILPNQTKMAALARKFGVRVFYHTDGAAQSFLPDLVNTVGINLINPLQWRCPGMERETLVRDYSRQLVFHGGIDNQHTLPFGTVAEVRHEVRDCAAIFKNSRWICAPCHNIQNVTPVENVLALYDEAHKVQP